MNCEINDRKCISGSLKAFFFARENITQIDKCYGIPTSTLLVKKWIFFVV